jgi:hypothetical protein
MFHGDEVKIAFTRSGFHRCLCCSQAEATFTSLSKRHSSGASLKEAFGDVSPSSA